MCSCPRYNHGGRNITNNSWPLYLGNVHWETCRPKSRMEKVGIYGAAILIFSHSNKCNQTEARRRNSLVPLCTILMSLVLLLDKLVWCVWRIFSRVQQMTKTFMAAWKRSRVSPVMWVETILHCDRVNTTCSGHSNLLLCKSFWNDRNKITYMT